MAEPSSPLQGSPSTSRRSAASVRNRGAGDAVYSLGVIGALIYFWHDAASFWQHVLAVLKSLIWPALLVYDALRALKG